MPNIELGSYNQNSKAKIMSNCKKADNHVHNVHHKNAYNYLNKTPNESRCETACCENESITVKGEAMTIQEIIKRYNAGQNPEEKMNFYMDVEDINMINHYYNPGALDFTDLDAMRRKNEQMHKAVKKAIEAQEKIKQKEAREKKLKEEGWTRDQPRDKKTGEFIDSSEQPDPDNKKED